MSSSTCDILLWLSVSWAARRTRPPCSCAPPAPSTAWHCSTPQPPARSCLIVTGKYVHYGDHYLLHHVKGEGANLLDGVESLRPGGAVLWQHPLHTIGELAMNWSMMHWAVLAKCPNCPSHSTRALGLVME